MQRTSTPKPATPKPGTPKPARAPTPSASPPVPDRKPGSYYRTTTTAPAAGPSTEGAAADGAPPPPVKIYNAVYSSVQVYECMIRGIAVMRRRTDSFVNATQILKVAGVDKGRRTKILEKEILPGKHEIVQGGYGKYQGTWIPLERGRDVATQYGVITLLKPLFDFTPSTSLLGGGGAYRVGMGMGGVGVAGGMGVGVGAGAGLGALSGFGSYGGHGHHLPGVLAPPPIMPGSALRLLNQGRAQGLFTPSTSGATRFTTPGPGPSPGQGTGPTPPPQAQAQALKRPRSEASVDPPTKRVKTKEEYGSYGGYSDSVMTPIPSPGPHSSSHPNSHLSSQSYSQSSQSYSTSGPAYGSIAAPVPTSTTPPTPNTPATPLLPAPTASAASLAPPAPPTPRFSTKPSHVPTPLKDPRRAAIIASISQSDDPVPVMNLLREISTSGAAASHSQYQQPSSYSHPPTNPQAQVPFTNSHSNSHSLSHPNPNSGTGNGGNATMMNQIDIDTPLDSAGHTALHIAASLSRMNILYTLLANNADVHRGNHLGETALMRGVLSTHAYEGGTLGAMLSGLSGQASHTQGQGQGGVNAGQNAGGLGRTILTLDTSKKSVIHHIVLLAGVKGRGVVARYYLDQVLTWIATNSSGMDDNQSLSSNTSLSQIDPSLLGPPGGLGIHSLPPLLDLQDEHGDTALNIAARVGSKSLVRTLLEVGAKRDIGNRMGLRAVDWGVDVEELYSITSGVTSFSSSVGSSGGGAGGATGAKLGVGGGEGKDNRGGISDGRADNMMQQMLRPPPVSAPVQKSQDVIADMTSMLTSLSASFLSEIKVKQDALDVTQAHLRAATRELSEQRKKIREWQSICREGEVLRGKKRNLESVLTRMRREEELEAAASQSSIDTTTTMSADTTGATDTANATLAPTLGSASVSALTDGVERERDGSKTPNNHNDPRTPSPLGAELGFSGSGSRVGLGLGSGLGLGLGEDWDWTGRETSVGLEVLASVAAAVAGPGPGLGLGTDAMGDAAPTSTTMNVGMVDVAKTAGITGAIGSDMDVGIDSAATMSASSAGGLVGGDKDAEGDVDMDASADEDDEAPDALETTSQSASRVVLDTTPGTTTSALELTSGTVAEPTMASTGAGVDTTMDIYSGTDPKVSAAAFKYRGAKSLLSSSGLGLGNVEDLSEADIDPKLPASLSSSLPSSDPSDKDISLDPSPTSTSSPSQEDLIHLRRILLFQRRLSSLLSSHLQRLKDKGTESDLKKEWMSRRIVSLCTGVEVGGVDGMLDDLIIAMESDLANNGSLVDIGRVSGFMQKVRDGMI